MCLGTSGLTGSTLLLPATFSLLSSLTRAHSPAYGSTATFSKAVTSPWHRIPLPWYLVSHPPHSSAALNGGHFNFFFFFHISNKFFDLLMWYITLIDLWTLKNSCIPGMNPISSWRMLFLMYCWIQIAGILLRIFASMFISDIGLHLFSCDVSVWFWYQDDGGLIEWVWKFSFLCNFLKQSRKDGD